jgi:hypothetical protein
VAPFFFEKKNVACCSKIERCHYMENVLFFGLLFGWAQVWGFTSERSLADFVVSFNFSKSPNITLV